MPAGVADGGAGTVVDTVRRRNLSIVLGLVHRTRALSRAELTRATGLNRSTVGDLVGELAELGLVVESEPEARGTAGRPSPLVQPHPGVVAIAVNPEIDALTAGAVGFGGAVVDRIRRPITGETSATAVESIAAEVVEELTARLPPECRVAGVGLALPGLVRAEDGLVRNAPHLGWTDEPFAARLAERTGSIVVAANDASLGCRAEHTFGAGRGVRDLVYVNGGASGIGGGLVVDGAPVRGVDGYAGEIGHTLVERNGLACHCGANGCLETEVRRERVLAALRLGSVDDDELEAALVASDSDDVRAEVRRQLEVLGFALGNLVNVLNPRLIVLGGFLSALYAVAPDVLDEAMSARGLAAPREHVRIARAELGANRLLIGAAELAFDRVLADPAGFA